MRHSLRRVVVMSVAGLAMSCAVLVGLDGYDVVVDCPNGANCADKNVVVDGSISSSDGGGVDGGALGDGSSGGVDVEVDSGPPNPIFVAYKREIWKLDIVTRQVSQHFVVGDCSGDFNALVMTEGGTFFAGTGGYYPSLSSIFMNDAGTPACAEIIKGNFDDALTFVPKGVLDATTEVIVGYNKNSDYIRVDQTTGMVQILTLNPVTPRKAKGDLAAHGSVGYLLAETGDCPNGCVLEVDLKTGAVAKKLGDLPEKNVGGLAFVRGRLYAFAQSGSIFVLDIAPFGVIDVITPSIQHDWGPATSLNEP